MKQIGFKNFRRFKDLPPIDLSPITFFVGENNSGKSTVVKGILALSDFLKSNPITFDFEEFDMFDFEDNKSEEKIINIRRQRTQEILKNIKFSFNASYLAHIGTFKRALYNKSDSNIISFRAKIGYLHFEINIKGNPSNDEAVSGNVSSIMIYLSSIGLHLNYDFFDDKTTMLFLPPNRVEFKDDTPEEVKEFISNFTEQITIEFRISDYWSPVSSDFISSLISSTEDIINITLFPPSDDRFAIFARSMRMRNVLSHVKPLVFDNKTKKFLLSYCKMLLGHEYSDRHREDIVPFRLPVGQRRLRSIDVEYLYAHAVSQTVLYSAKDTNDYLSRTIHEFASLPKQTQIQKRKFIIHWMKEFGVGKEYSISSVGGEAHIVKITNFDDKKVNLADKGMGSIQLMVLLFRIAINLPTSKADRYPGYKVVSKNIIIIEEPEQNLHPMLQSKLTDLFFDLFMQYGYRFIIETHSEYMVRRSQVIVGDNFDTEEKLKNNPFKVYYFPADGAPYDMIYTPSGLFKRKFGEGFISEAGRLHMAVLKNAKKQQ